MTFSSLTVARILGECSTIHFPPVLFFFFEVEISLLTLIPLFMPGSVHSGSASWADCGWVTSDKLCVSSFPDRFLHCQDCSVVSPLQLHWVMGVYVFRCNGPPALLAEWPGYFACHYGNMGVEWTLNKSQHTKFTFEKEILLLLLPGFKLATFWSQVWRSTNKLSQLPQK